MSQVRFLVGAQSTNVLLLNGQVAELVYALVLGTNAARLEGSSPSLPTRESKFIYSRRDEKEFSL